jgi:TetR/AcrR family transcriptional regulator, cholesterol catabolism regulator
MAATTAKRQANRLGALLDVAAAQFAERGYHATTIRELAAAAGLTPGAIYFHVPTKQHLLVAVYQEGVRRILERLNLAIGGIEEPLERLEAAIRAHLESVLDASAYARVIIRVLPDDVPEAARELKALRERYESRFRGLFADLPLPAGRDRKLARLLLIGALNWTPVWYRRADDDLRPLVRASLALLGIAEDRGAGR